MDRSGRQEDDDAMEDGAATSAALCEAGWAALGEGRWTAARASFEQAVHHQETAEAVEGLSWAGWWLDDASVALGARERAFHLYRSAGDPAGAARTATWLAVDHLDFHGAVAVTEGWLSRARRLLAGVEPGPDHGWLAFMEGYLAYVGSDATTAVQRALTTSALGDRLDVPDLQILGRALRGAALVSAAQVRDGMRCLDEAAAAALDSEVRIPISSAWACCLLVSACSSVLDYRRACEWCDRIREFADRYGSRYMLAFCRAEYGAVHLWRGNWTRAESLLETAIEDFTRSRPAWVTSSVVALADLRRRQGRSAETRRLLEGVGPDFGAQLCLARLALDEGDPLTAAESAERVLRRLPERDRVARLAPLDLLARSQLSRGALEQASSTVEELRRLERLVGTSALRATVDLLEGMLAAASGHPDAARCLLEDAVDGLDAAGACYEAARARLALASSLALLDRRAQAQREAVAALDALRALAAGPELARARRLLVELGLPPAPGPPVTRREREVLGLLAEGLTNRQIADRLVLSEHTVHRHVSSILRRLGVDSRTAAAVQAARWELPGAGRE
jgi:LuxR family transcriptional regulator, maltose regulon positive regulatory protein